MNAEFVLGESVVVSERDYHRGTVTKVARRYLTVASGHREWQFDKETRSPRGEHCGYIPRLMTLTEYDRLLTWQALYDAWRKVPHLGAGVPTEAMKAAVIALSACQPNHSSPPQPQPDHKRGQGEGGEV